MKTRIVVLGSNFGGATAALELKRKLKEVADVTVISPSQNFTFIPSLIWVPFGKRKIEDITFPIKPVMEKRGIHFIQDKAVKISPASNLVTTENHGDISYDYLVVATGIQMDYPVTHLKPEDGYVQNIVIPQFGLRAYDKFKELVNDPGPVVVGASQGASCMGAAYEYLFNLDKELRLRKVREKVDLTWITPEPFLGHFGIGGITGGQKMLELFMKMYNIKWYTNASIERIEKDQIILKNGKILPYKMAMIMPPFVGAEVMRNTTELVDDKGFLTCNDRFQHTKFPNVYGVGLAVQLRAPFSCEVPFGVPKTGFPTETSAKVAVKNIVTSIQGKGSFKELAWGKMPAVCVMDAGQKEVLIFGDHLFKPRRFALMIPNIFNHWTKLLIEKYFLFKFRHGWGLLP